MIFMTADLSTFHVDVCALQEVRRSGNSFADFGDYRVWWFNENTKGQYGVGFAVRKCWLSQVVKVAGIKASGGRFITLRMKLHQGNQETLIVSGDAPTSVRPRAKRHAFYDQLAKTLGDFNCHLGRDNAVAGPWTMRKDQIPSDSAEDLMALAVTNRLKDVASHFRCSDSRRWTWSYARVRVKAVLDHILVPQSMLSAVLRSRTVDARMTTKSTDHRLLCVDMRVHRHRPTARQQQNAHQQPLYWTKVMVDSKVAKHFAMKSDELIGTAPTTDPSQVSPEDLQRMADHVRTTLQEAGEETLDRMPRRTRQPPLSEQTIRLLQAKREHMRVVKQRGCRTRQVSEQVQQIRLECDRAVRADKEKALEDNGKRIEQAFRRSNMAGFAEMKRQQRNPTDVKEITPTMNEFSEFFEEKFKEDTGDSLDFSLIPTGHLEEAVNDAKAVLDDEELVRPITLKEVEEATSQIKSNRAPGGDGLRTEAIKQCGKQTLAWLVWIMNVCFCLGMLTAIDATGILIPIAKKALATSCDLFRPITLTTTFYKLYARVIFNRISERIRQWVGYTQAGFVSGRGTSDNLAILRQLIEKHIEYDVTLFCLMIDFKGAFDRIRRSELYRVLCLFLPSSLVKACFALYAEVLFRVRLGQDLGKAKQSHSGVRQGCPASPAFFTAVLRVVIISLRSVAAGLKIGARYLLSLEYADDVILFATKGTELQDMLDRIVKIGIPLGLRLAPPKCEAIAFSRNGRRPTLTLKIGDVTIPWKEQVTYLGSRFSSDGTALAAVQHRIACARTNMVRFGPRVFQCRKVSLRIKGLYLRVAIIPTMLYGLEMAPLRRADIRKLDAYFLAVARHLLRVHHPNHLSYTTAEARLQCRRPSMYLRQQRWRWLGHVLRSTNPFHEGVLRYHPAASRPMGRPRWRWSDLLRHDWNDIGRRVQRDQRLRPRSPTLMPLEPQDALWTQLRTMALDRDNWHKDFVETVESGVSL